MVGGNYRGPADFNPSNSAEYRLPANLSATTGYVAKLTSAGGLTWAAPLAGAQLWDLTLDAAGSVYVTGSFSGTYTAPGTPPVTSAGDSDIFVTKLTTGGSVAWSVTFGGTSSDIAWGLAVGGDGSVYVCGQYSGTADFDPGAGVSELTNPAYADMFLVKLRQV